MFKEDDVQTELEGDEALVLFELLSRFSNDDKLVVEHQAEEQALLNLLSLLEKRLVAPLRDDYDLLISEARKNVSTEEGGT